MGELSSVRQACEDAEVFPGNLATTAVRVKDGLGREEGRRGQGKMSRYTVWEEEERLGRGEGGGGQVLTPLTPKKKNSRT